MIDNIQPVTTSVPVALFRNRHQAGEQLYHEVTHDHWDHILVVALSDAAVEVAYPIASLNMGTIARVDAVDCVAAQAPIDAQREPPEGLRSGRLEGRRLAVPWPRRMHGVKGRTVVVVDDGSTGATLLATVARSVRMGEPARLVVAVPVLDHDFSDLVGPGVVDDLHVLYKVERIEPGTDVYQHGAAEPSARALSLIDRVNEVFIEEIREQARRVGCA